MEPSARAPGYDLFKLVVAIILLILFLLLTRRQAPQSAIPLFESPTFTASPSAGTMLSTPSIASTVSAPQATLTSITPTEAANSISSATGTNAQPPTVVSSDTPTPLPDSTATFVSESITTPIAAIPIPIDACEAAGTWSRLQVGMNATILRRLNFRSSPGIRDNWLLTNIPGTRVEIVGGPECVPHFTGAYVWWQIKMPNERIGWSAEASLLGSFYFIEPVE